MKRCIIFVFLGILLLIPWQCTRAESWVEIVRFQEQGTDYLTNPFTCNYSEWRISYATYATAHEPFPIDWYYLNMTVYRIGDSSTDIKVETIIVPPTQGKYYYHVFHNQTGNFYINVSTGILDSYTIIVEQDIDSVLAPPSPPSSPMPTSNSSENNSASIPTEVLYAVAVGALVAVVVVAVLAVKRRNR